MPFVSNAGLRLVLQTSGIWLQASGSTLWTPVAISLTILADRSAPTRSSVLRGRIVQLHLGWGRGEARWDERFPRLRENRPEMVCRRTWGIDIMCVGREGNGREEGKWKCTHTHKRAIGRTVGGYRVSYTHLVKKTMNGTIPHPFSCLDAFAVVETVDRGEIMG